jgi:pimeloyl-ACP methyl ester carboxylesterase
MMLSHFSVGTGSKTLVFLHGMCEDKSVWVDTILAMGDYRCVALDLPGFGESEMPDSIETIEDVASEVVESLKILGVSRAIMFGHSYGGYVALALARKYPDYLSGLGLVHSTAYADSEERKILRSKLIDFIGKQGVKIYAENFFPEIFATAHRAKFASKINELVKRALSINPNYLQRTLSIMANRPDSIQWLKETKLPILYVIGKQDNAIPFETAMTQAAFPKNCIVQILEHVGHIAMIEDENKTKQMIQFFSSYCLENENQRPN